MTRPQRRPGGCWGLPGAPKRHTSSLRVCRFSGRPIHSRRPLPALAAEFAFLRRAALGMADLAAVVGLDAGVVPTVLALQRLAELLLQVLVGAGLRSDGWSPAASDCWSDAVDAGSSSIRHRSSSLAQIQDRTGQSESPPGSTRSASRSAPVSSGTQRTASWSCSGCRLAQGQLSEPDAHGSRAVQRPARRRRALHLRAQPDLHAQFLAQFAVQRRLLPLRPAPPCRRGTPTCPAKAGGAVRRAASSCRGRCSESTIAAPTIGLGSVTAPV